MPGTQILKPDGISRDMLVEQLGDTRSESNKEEVYTPAEFSRLSELFAQAEAGEPLSLELEDQHDPELYIAAARFAERMIGQERGQEYTKHFQSLADGIRAGQDFGNQYESSFRQLLEEVQQRIVGSVAERARTIGQETFVEQDKKDSIEELRIAAERGQIYSLNQIPEEYFSDPEFVQELATALPEQYGEMKKVLQEKVGSSRFYDLLQNAFDTDNKRIQRNQQRAEQEREAPQIDAARQAIEQAANSGNAQAVPDELAARRVRLNADIEQPNVEIDDSLEFDNELLAMKDEFNTFIEQGDLEALDTMLEALTDNVAALESGELSSEQGELLLRVIDEIMQGAQRIDQSTLDGAVQKQLEYLSTAQAQVVDVLRSAAA